MTEKLNTVLINFDYQGYELIKTYLQALDFLTVSDFSDDIKTLQEKILKERPEIVIVNISEKTDYILNIVSKILAVHKNCKIIALSDDYSANTVIKVMRTGIREIVNYPIIKDDFLNTILKLKNQNIVTKEKKSRVITVFSNKGGIGKTSVAVNTALELANITKEKIALVDLNLQMGDITTFLDIVPSFDVSYTVNNLAKMNPEFMLNTLECYKDTNLYVLAEPPSLEKAKQITPEQITNLIKLLRETFSYIVIDISPNFDKKTIAALDNSDLILLVTMVNLPAIRNCQRCLDIFDKLGYDANKTQIVLNRFMENDEIKVDDVESVLNRDVYWKIPNNYFAIMSSINKGIPVSIMQPDSNIAQSYQGLAVKLSDNILKQNFAQKSTRTSEFNFMSLFE
ncbi:AAA family ATPase [bacterium]|nr:AAA family ATPase [bacterium]